MTKSDITKSSKKVNKYKIPKTPFFGKNKNGHSGKYAGIAFRHLKLTKERLKMVLNYNPETGLFKWLDSGKSPHTFQINGFNPYDDAYGIHVDGHNYVAAHLAHLYMEGSLPKRMKIVYLDGFKRNNVWANLKFIQKQKNPGTDGGA